MDSRPGASPAYSLPVVFSSSWKRVIVKSGVSGIIQAATWSDSLISMPSLNGTPSITLAR